MKTLDLFAALYGVKINLSNWVAARPEKYKILLQDLQTSSGFAIFSSGKQFSFFLTLLHCVYACY